MNGPTAPGPNPDSTATASVFAADATPGTQATRPNDVTAGWFATLVRTVCRPVPALAALALVVSLAFAVFGPGQPDDEGEHLHAAYLMGRWGERPHEDFFQHHPKLLWTILSPVFRFGPVSPTGAVFAGRCLVAILLLATFLGVGRIARGRHARWLSPLNSAAVLAAFTVVVYPEAVALRPETLGLPLTVWGWTFARGRHPGAALAGGFLAGLACEAAPRFLAVLPIFVIPSRPDRAEPEWKRVMAVMAGFVAGFVTAAVVSGQTPSEILFNIHFSALLQKIGAGSSFQLPSMAATLLCLFLFFRHVVPAEFKAARAYPAWEAAAWAALAVGVCSAWPFLYGQSLVPLVAACLIVVAHAEASCGRAPRPAAGLVVNLTAAVVVLSAAMTLARGSTVFRTLSSRESLAAALLPDDTILMRSRLHPIVVQDASFYPVPLIDSDRRTTHAMRAARVRWQLPPFDYATDIRRSRPRLLDTAFVFEALPDAGPDFLAWIEANYRQVNRWLLVRRDTGADAAGAGWPADNASGGDR
ncbi:MAG: hypothetical protein ACK6CT_12030 [Planctomycetia bacterium]